MCVYIYISMYIISHRGVNASNPWAHSNLLVFPNTLVAIVDLNIWINDGDEISLLQLPTPHSVQLWKYPQAFSAIRTLRIDSKIRRMRWERNTGQSLGLRSEQAEYSEIKNMKNIETFETTWNSTNPQPLPWRDQSWSKIVWCCVCSGKIVKIGLSEISTPSSSAFTLDTSRCLLGMILQIMDKAGYGGYGFARNIKISRDQCASPKKNPNFEKSDQWKL